MALITTSLRIVSAEPEAWQEMHSPTEEVTVKLDATRTVSSCRRRKADARLFDAMDGDQERAIVWLTAAFMSMFGPCSVKVQNLDAIRMTVGDGGQEFQIDAQAAYFAWARECYARSISHAAIVDILMDNKSSRDVDTRRKKRNGWATQNLIEGLDLFCKMQGWK